MNETQLKNRNASQHPILTPQSEILRENSKPKSKDILKPSDLEIDLPPLAKPLPKDPNPENYQDPHDKFIYTSILCNTKMKFCGSFLVLAIISCHIGLIFSFQAAVVITYQDDGLDVKYKTILNLLGIPFLLGPLYSPFLFYHHFFIFLCRK